MSLLDLFDGVIRKIRLVPVFVIEVHVLHPATGEELVLKLFVLLEFARLTVCPASDGARRKIHSQANSGAIQDANRASEQFGRVVQVLMHVDDPMLRSPCPGLATRGLPILLRAGRR